MADTLRPVGDAERDHSGWDLFLLWAGAGIALPEIWAGGLLLKLGLAAGLVAAVAGHLLGNSVLAAAAWMGARHGIPAIVSTRAALGYRGSWLAGVLNIIQLVGWTGFTIWVGGSAAAALPGLNALSPRFWMAVIGALTTAWALLGHRHWRVAQRVGVVLLLGLVVLMTGRVLHAYPLAALRAIPRDPSLPFGLGLDFVVVMPISWLPLVADYTRYARSPARGTAGTWLGYFVASTWMYAVGLCAALATRTDSPDAMVIQLLADTGWVGPALLIIFFSTITTTFLNVFSNAVSIQSLFPRAPEKGLVLLSGALGTGLAVAVDGSLYEPFLLAVGSAFCPLFGIVLADYFLLRRGRVDAATFYQPDGFGHRAGVSVPALLVWAAGFAFYQAASRAGWPCGAALPSLAASGALYLFLMQIMRRSSSRP